MMHLNQNAVISHGRISSLASLAINPVSDLNILNQFVDIQFDDWEPSSETYATNQQG